MFSFLIAPVFGPLLDLLSSVRLTRDTTPSHFTPHTSHSEPHLSSLTLSSSHFTPHTCEVASVQPVSVITPLLISVIRSRSLLPFWPAKTALYFYSPYWTWRSIGVNMASSGQRWSCMLRSLHLDLAWLSWNQ